MSRLGDRIRRAMTCEYWTIAYRKRHNGIDLLKEKSVTGFTKVKSPKYVSFADPFLYRYHNCTYLFYEKQNLTDMKGTLWCRNLDIPTEKPRIVLSEDFHLSYPQIFQYGRYTYMIPETRGAGDVRLYKCMRFPDVWQLVGPIFRLNAVDTTFYCGKPGEGYFFSYVDHHNEVYRCLLDEDRLTVRESSRILEAEDSKADRCGGSLIESNGKLYRICQDCSERYGGGLLVNEIEKLDETGVAEHTVRKITPDAILLGDVNPVGIHTYNRNGDYEVIDILHRQCGVGVLFKKLEWKLFNWMH